MEELDLKEVFSMFWSKRGLITAIICLFILIGIVYTLIIVTPEYQSSTTLVLTQANSNNQSDGKITNNDVTLNSNLIATYTDILTSDKVINQVIDNLNRQGVDDLDKGAIKKNVKVEIKSEDSNVLIMTITSDTPEKAMKITNEIANVGIVEINEYFNYINNIKILDEAVENPNPSNINHIRDIIIFAVIGFVVAFAYILITYMLDNTVKSAEEIEKSCKTIVLASIPIYEKTNKKGGRN